MQILILADDDEAIHNLPAGAADVLISCGNLPDELILETARRAGTDQILAVKGHRDLANPFLPPIQDLHQTVVKIGGISFGGFAGAWKYKPKGHFLFEQMEVSTLLHDFPPVDVFVAHTSPRGIHDRDDDVNHGFEAFLEYIDDVQPQLFLHGHQMIPNETARGTTRIFGVYPSRRLSLSCQKLQARPHPHTHPRDLTSPD